MFYRTNPCGNGYAIAAGLEQVIEYIKDLHFGADDIEYLRSTGIFEEEFLEYLKTFRFTGDIITNYFDYFSPLPWKLRMYFQDFDSEWHEYTIYMADTSLNDAIFCVLFLAAASIAFSVISYLRIRKRTT